MSTPLPHRGKKPVYIFRPCYIASYSKRTYTAPRNFRSDLVGSCGLIAIGDGDIISTLCQSEGCSCSNATRSAGDESHRLSDSFHLFLTGFLLPPHRLFCYSSKR